MAATIITTVIDSHGLPDGYELYLESFTEALEIDESDPASSNPCAQLAEDTPAHNFVAKTADNQSDAKDVARDESIVSDDAADISDSLTSRSSLQASKTRLTTGTRFTIFSPSSTSRYSTSFIP